MPIVIRQRTFGSHIRINNDFSITTTAIKKEPVTKYRLEFEYQHWMLAPTDTLRVVETLEALCWANSPLKTQAEKIGWVTDKNKLPRFDNRQLYLPHSLYYSLNVEFIRHHAPHITPLAAESHDYTSGAIKKGGRYAS